MEPNDGKPSIKTRLVIHFRDRVDFGEYDYILKFVML